jgi:hypothetical protein
MKKLSDHCKESPAFKRKIISLVLRGSFDSFNSSVGRANRANEKGEYCEKERNK